MSTQPLAESVDTAHEAYANKVATMRWLDGLIDELNMLRQQIYDGEEEILAATLEGLADEREKWLRDRQKNDWVEGDESDIDTSLGVSRFLGVFGQRGKKKEDED